MKKLFIIGAVPGFMLLFLMLAAVTGGSGVAPSIVAPVVATEEKTMEYATIASKLGAPWEIIMLSDAIRAEAEGRNNIEDENPMFTSLQFLILTEVKERYEIVGYEVDEDTGESTPIYDWVVRGIQKYYARDGVLGYLKLHDDDVDGLTPEDLATEAERVAADKTDKANEDNDGDPIRFTATYAVNGDFQDVLTQYVGLEQDYADRVIELYHAGYADLLGLSEETRERIHAIQAQYGVYQFADGDYVNAEGITFTDGGREVIYYNQLDSRWADEMYGRSGTIGRAGCGPTAMSIVISTMTDNTVDPLYMSDWSVANGYRCEGSGSYRTLIPGAAEAFGLTVDSCGTNEGQRVVNSLADGALVVAIMGPGHFTRSGHFIVLRGVTSDGKILVADPASISRSGQAWDLSLILREVSKTATDTGPLWIIYD